MAVGRCNAPSLEIKYRKTVAIVRSRRSHSACSPGRSMLPVRDLEMVPDVGRSIGSRWRRQRPRDEQRLTHWQGRDRGPYRARWGGLGSPVAGRLIVNSL